MSAILRQYRVTSTSRPAEFFCDTSGAPRFDLDQPYQRGVVWGLRRQQNLIKSLLMGIPVPAIMLNDRFGAEFSHHGYSRDRCWSYAVVDGKQRITALRRFLNSEFSVPAGWFADGADGEVRFADLPVTQQRRLRNTPIAVTEGQFATLDAERELFDLLNFGGLAQGEADDDDDTGWAP